MTASLLALGLIQFAIVAIVVRKANSSKISWIRAIVVGLIAGVSAIAAHIFFQQISFPEAIARWVQTGGFR